MGKWSVQYLPNQNSIYLNFHCFQDNIEFILSSSPHYPTYTQLKSEFPYKQNKPHSPLKITHMNIMNEEKVLSNDMKKKKKLR